VKSFITLHQINFYFKNYIRYKSNILANLAQVFRRTLPLVGAIIASDQNSMENYETKIACTKLRTLLFRHGFGYDLGASGGHI
jgi:hypothetical protein